MQSIIFLTVSDDAPLGTFKEGKDFNYAVFKPVSMKLPPKWKDYKGYQFVRKNKTPLGDAFDHVFLLADARGRIAVIKGHYTETVVPSTPAEKTFFERIRKEYGMPEAEDLLMAKPGFAVAHMLISLPWSEYSNHSQ